VMPLVATACRTTECSMWLKRRIRCYLSVCLVNRLAVRRYQRVRKELTVVGRRYEVQGAKSLYKKENKRRMAPGNVAACGSVSVSWGYPGNLASLQCQLGCLLPLGKHLLTHTHTHTRARAYSGIVFHIKTRFSWPACSGMTPSRKCIMNLTNIPPLYGYPSTC
jgi:hypothetical protein